MRYLIDSNWVINALRGSSAHRQRLSELTANDATTVAISVAVLAELYVGVYRTSDPVHAERELLQFISTFPVLRIDSAISRRFGQEKARLLEQGNIIEDVDLLIATTALQYDLTLLTNNVRHFERIDGLRIETA